MAEESYPCYKERKDNNGHWYWVYYASNGKAIARSSESYVNRSDCYHSVTLVQNSQSDQVYYYD